MYPRKMGWGHSSVSQVAELAARARVKNLYLVHHDPDDNDDIIDAKLARSRELLGKWGAAPRVVAPGSERRSSCSAGAPAGHPGRPRRRLRAVGGQHDAGGRIDRRPTASPPVRR